MNDVIVNVNTDDNYIALIASIFNQGTPEQSFLRLCNKSINFAYTDEDTKDMIEFRKMNYSYAAIAKMYNITDVAVFNRIKRYKQRVMKSHDLDKKKYSKSRTSISRGENNNQKVLSFICKANFQMDKRAEKYSGLIPILVQEQDINDYELITFNKLLNAEKYIYYNSKKFKAGKKSLKDFLEDEIKGYTRIIKAIQKDSIIKHNNIFYNSQVSIFQYISNKEKVIK